MKTFVQTFALSLALCAAAGATAQTWSTASSSRADSVLLSETTDGNYIVRRYLLRSQGDAGYWARYQINLATLSSSFDGNTKQLDALSGFVSNLMTDTLMSVKGVEITGYSSPDGPMTLNEALAKKRAMDFKAYVDKKYDFSKKFHVTTKWVAEDWETTRALVQEWPVPDKQEVLKVIDGKWTPEQKEMALKKMPAAWDYMKKNILPPLRRVELTINYGDGNIVEQRTMIPKPKPAPEPKAATEPCCEVVVDESITGIIAEMPGAKTDFDKMTRQERREMKKAEKAAKQETERLEKMAKKEAKIAEELVKKQTKAADKIAKKAEKEARKMAKAEAKAAKRAAKALEKGMK